MFKNSSAKYYENKMKILQKKKLVKGIKGHESIKIYAKMKIKN